MKDLGPQALDLCMDPDSHPSPVPRDGGGSERVPVPSGVFSLSVGVRVEESLSGTGPGGEGGETSGIFSNLQVLRFRRGI